MIKELFKYFGIIFLFIISLLSCKPDDVYYDLSTNEKEFLSFEINDTFKLKNFETNEIINFIVESKEFDYYEGGSYGSDPIPKGPPADIYVERGTLKFTDPTNCYNGDIYIRANEDGGFIFGIYLGECFTAYNEYYEYYNDFLLITNVAGIEYQNAYVLRSTPGNLFYSKEKGILKIIDYEENIIFGIIE